MAERPPQPRSSPPPPSGGFRLPGPVTALLALALYALLVDAAVETWQSVSTVRFWVVAPVGLYVGYTLWLLRQPRASRPSGSTSIWISLFVFLAILAVSSTLQGGMSDGVRVASLRTPAVLTVVSIGVVLLAAVSLVISSPLPIAGRAVLAAACAYSVVALAMGLATGRSYLQLLQGRSPWERLPFWLQGAFVGTLVLVPLAFAVELATALAVLRVRGRLHRIVAFALQALIAYYAWTS
jgi:hypothetical protein